MLSLSFHFPCPKASALHDRRCALARVTGTQKRLSFPIPIAKHERYNKAIKAFENIGEKLTKGFSDIVREEELPAGLRRELMPRHVAVIMDGNRRWAETRGLSANAGQEAGARRLIDLAMSCSGWGIEILTVFAMSTENWGRPEEEVSFLMNAFERSLKWGMPIFERENVRVSIIGDTSRIPKSLLKVRHEVEEATRNNSRGQLILAIDYGGRYDILQACKSIAQKANDNVIQLENLDETIMEQELETKCTKFPRPDLLVRTSGECRISNFYLWQTAHTQLFFSPVPWPDFGKDQLIEALATFQKTRRSFGSRIKPETLLY